MVVAIVLLSKAVLLVGDYRTVESFNNLKGVIIPETVYLLDL